MKNYFNPNTKFIVFTGVECSGKSTLSLQMQKHFSFPLVSETARTYLEKQDNKYQYKDLEKIARLHAHNIKKASMDNKMVLVDTAFYVLKIWSEFRFQKCASFIEDCLAHFSASYILCAPVCTWQADAQRASPDESERALLHKMYKEYLIKNNENFIEVAQALRKEKAIAFINHQIN